MSKHAIENLIADQGVIDRAFAAMITARATGSTGATEIHERRLADGTLESASTTVERIGRGYSENYVGTNGFRILGEGNEVVIVATSARAHRHADSDAELDAAVAGEDYIWDDDEPYDPDEDYKRSLLYGEDI
ncbi:hypothetical protein SCOTTMCG_143 [Mycobacterium phage ScottMcG]|uniref:Uncharacterized protein n=1 Tax=Mycobacterium phage ScottMcG TaxID=546807 RepID=B5LLC0_9CAUD|nr:hypothetical protein SCOTTMCG_143 [Mycobacterium phage ScottMcG]QAY08097.1 hypothetical protein SEA_EMMAELYSIA_148 [Mycobacterium phage EmmaElysia]QAY11256.1 hypothetical protein SEA_NAPOLEON13_144 [Mycobacterium phage Napoleon13]QAY15110.1 hypothetical protein SEA_CHICKENPHENDER_145 [Mycobacterium phage ChickenPhender]URP21449.1 hypothetical protein SEA_MCGEE_150 [Mycobacterium phage McGee]ACH62817.1 hypothetical protein SCOTTMCG_143 [Mycobacterium phage ScottMcG]